MKDEEKQKIIEEVTSLLILKIQFDNQLDKVLEIVEQERLVKGDYLKNLLTAVFTF